MTRRFAIVLSVAMTALIGSACAEDYPPDEGQAELAAPDDEVPADQAEGAEKLRKKRCCIAYWDETPPVSQCHQWKMTYIGAVVRCSVGALGLSPQFGTADHTELVTGECADHPNCPGGKSIDETHIDD